MIAARLRQVAAVDPNAPALMGTASISYAELLAALSRVRRAFERRDVKPGDFIMVSLPAGLQAAASFFACAELGAIFLPTNPGWRAAELQWLLEQTRPAAAIVLNSEAELWTAAGFSTGSTIFADRDNWPGTEDAYDSVSSVWPYDHPVACVVSSGSSGRPKIAVKTHGGMVDTAACVAQVCGISPGNRLLATVPPYHGSGLANNLILPLLNGAPLVCQERFEPAAAAAIIELHSVDYLVSSPVFYSLMIDANVPSSALASLRVCLSGGAPLPPSVQSEWRRRYGVPIWQAYGSSEAGMISIQSEDSADPRFAGRPLPMTDVRILSADDPLPVGEVGEIVVRGPGVVTRYLGEHEGPAPRFWNDYLRTGDLGWLDAEGRLYLSGRARPWINSGGVKIDPVEVQQVLSAMPGVRECLVEAAPGPGGRDIVAAVIAPEPGIELTRADVIQHCRKTLAEYKIPRVVRFVPRLATSLTGKRPSHVDARELH